MSWWVYLEDRTASPWCNFGSSAPEACSKPCYPVVAVDPHEEGGTHVVGGTRDAELNVTYNYGEFFRQALDKEAGLGWLDGKKAKDCIGRLADAVGVLGTEAGPDYWKKTPGNAGRALATLLAWANQHPEAVFRIS
jgi:hypothetical protein